MVPSIVMYKQKFIFSTQLKKFKYCHLTLNILFTITHLFAHS